MKLNLFLCAFLSMTPLLADGPLPECYMRDLEEHGYCVIPEVITADETKQLYERVWHEYVEKAWPACRMDGQKDWKETFPIHNLYGIFAGPAGQTQVMWDLRQDPRIVEIFAHIWNTNDLIVSMDGLGMLCPPEIREMQVEPWPHVDQTTIIRDNVAHNNNPSVDFVSESSLKTGPFTIQGQFLFEDSFEGDGGFYCVPKSHLQFTEFAPQIEALTALKLPRGQKAQQRTQFFKDFFTSRMDEDGNPYRMQHVTAPKGSLILWDSRTVHWNQYPSKNRPYTDSPKVRMVGYLCYVPKARLTAEGKALRQEAFEKGISTGHNPAYTQLKPTIVQDGCTGPLEDPNYVQPTIRLTPLGQSLLY